jgi:prepilin-type N-terminal cleavage/methylation domain-containing protein
MGNKSKVRAFTLVELLVVIGVIAILAGIVLGVLPAAQSKSVRTRVKAELIAVETAINSYKAKNSFYPPGNLKDGFPNSLFYELTGTTHEPVGGALVYRSNFSPPDPALKAAELKQLFGTEGFLNTAPTAEQRDVPSFYKTLLPRQVRQMDTNFGGGTISFKVLAAARYGMDRQPAVWRYNASSPTNNVGEFDLWVEVDLRGPTVIGNWEK